MSYMTADSEINHANAASTKQNVLRATQSKAQELLQTLDAARRQKINNEKLKNLCLDTEEVMLRLHQQTLSQKQQREMQRALQKAQELLVEFEKEVCYTQLRKFNVDRYMADCGQEMSIRELIKPEDTPVVTHAEALADEIRKMRGQGANSEAFTSYIDFSCKQLEKVIALFRESKLNAQPWAKVVQPMLVLLRDVMHTQPIRHCLVEADEDCKRMQFNVTECSEAQSKMLMEGEMEAAEQMYYTKISMQESLSDLVKKKFGILEQEEVTAFKIPMKRVHEAHNQSTVEISTLLKGYEKLKQRAQSDLNKLMGELEKVNGEDYNTTRVFVEAKEESNRVLSENMRQQQECWKKIEEMEKQLILLGQARNEEIKRRIKAVDRESKRNVEFSHFQQFVAQQKQLLQITIRNCDLAEEITDVFEEFVSSGCNSIERRLRETEKEIEAERLAIHEQYYQEFRTMYLTIGDLEYKKQRHMETLEEKIQTAHINQEFCMDTFNPKAKEYAQQKKTLQTTKSEMEKQIDSLRSKEVQFLEWFQPTEKALIEAGKTFKHPSQELREINESRSNKLIEYHELMAQQEEDETEYAEEMAEIERLRALTASTSNAARIMASSTTPHSSLSLPGPNASSPNTPSRYAGSSTLSASRSMQR